MGEVCPVRQPEHRAQVLHRLRRGALEQVVERADGDGRAARRVRRRADARARRVHDRRDRHLLDAGDLDLLGALVGGAHRGGEIARAGQEAAERRDHQPAPDRQEVRHERQPHLAARDAREGLLDLRRVLVARDAVRRHVLGDLVEEQAILELAAGARRAALAVGEERERVDGARGEERRELVKRVMRRGDVLAWRGSETDESSIPSLQKARAAPRPGRLFAALYATRDALAVRGDSERARALERARRDAVEVMEEIAYGR